MTNRFSLVPGLLFVLLGSACSDPASAGDQNTAGATAGGGLSGAGPAASGGLSGAGASGGSGGGLGSSGAGGLTGASGSAGGQTALTLPLLATVLGGGCAIDSHDELRCWGSGQDMTPWPTPPKGPFKAVAGGSEMCGLGSSGSLSCFAPPDILGADLSDNLKNGTFSQVAVGLNVCALDAQGLAQCEISAGVVQPPSDQFNRIAVGDRYGCGIRKSDQSIVCWGSSAIICSDTMQPDVGLTKPPSGSFVEIASGLSNSCAIRSDGTLACWGAGSPGYNDPSVMCGTFRVNYGQSMPPSGTFKKVSVSPQHACAIRTDGTLACWGAGTVDQDCMGGNLDLCGQSLPPAGQFEQVSVSWFFSCAMRADHSLACWGANGLGQSTPPVDFP
jgi:hypothetical protein